MFNEFWRTFRWLLLSLVVFLVVLTAFLGLSFWTKFWGSLKSDIWWADNLPAFLIFTSIVGFVTWLVNVLREREMRSEFENWTLVVFWQGEESIQELYWEEVKRILSSDFERWKLVKSVVSGVGLTSLMTVHKAEQAGWCLRQDRKLIVNLDMALDCSHMTLRNGKNASVPTISQQSKSDQLPVVEGSGEKVV